MIKAIVLTVSLLCLAACDDTGAVKVNDDPTGGDNHARYMGTVDGCRLWSVNGGQFYFAHCRGGLSSSGWTHSSGKTWHYYAASSD